MSRRCITADEARRLIKAQVVLEIAAAVARGELGGSRPIVVEQAPVIVMGDGFADDLPRMRAARAAALVKKATERS